MENPGYARQGVFLSAESPRSVFWTSETYENVAGVETYRPNLQRARLPFRRIALVVNTGLSAAPGLRVFILAVAAYCDLRASLEGVLRLLFIDHFYLGGK